MDLPIDSLRVDLAIQVITFAHSVPFIFLFGYNQKFFLSVTKIALIQSCFFLLLNYSVKITFNQT